MPGRTRYVVAEGDAAADKAEVVALGRRNLQKGVRFDKYYERSPLGTPHFVLAREESSGQVVGMAALFPARLWIRGEPVEAAVGGDFAIDAGHRGFGPAFPLQRSLHSNLAGRGIACAYGVPNYNSDPVVARIGYESVAPLTRFAKVLRSRFAIRLYVRRSRAARALSALAAVTVDPLLPLVYRERRGAGKLTVERPAAFDDERFGPLWESLRQRHAIVGERSAEVLNWKYELDSPASPYSVFAVVQGDGMVAGYIVYRTEDDLRHVFDVACLDSQPAVDALISEFLLDARREKAVGISLLRLGPDDLLARRLRSFGFVERVADDHLRVFVDGRTPEGIDLHDPANWYYVVGDEDV